MKHATYNHLMRAFLFPFILYCSSATAAPFAYVVNRIDNTVSVIDIATNSVISTIDEGGPGPFGIAITRDDKTAYVANPNFFGPFGHTITPIDIATGAVKQPITVGTGPIYIGVPKTARGKTLYVTNPLSGDVTPVDIATNIAGPAIPVGNFPIGIAITPDDKTAYITLSDSATVVRIDIATNMVVGTPIVTGTAFVSKTNGIAITPDGKTAYVTNQGDGTVVRIDIATNMVTGSPIGTGAGSEPVFIAITPNGKFAYVSNNITNTVSVIDTGTNTVISTITGILKPGGIAITSDSKTAYVTSENANAVIPINIATNTKGTAIPVGRDPVAIAITPSLGLFAVTATIKKNIFLDHSELIGVITWTPSPSDVDFYRIYNGDTIIGTVSVRCPLRFFVRLQTNTLPQLSITAVDKDGSESSPILIEIS